MDNEDLKKPSPWYRLYHPIEFQGWNKKRHYFEGWYFKIADPKNRISLAIIPGISIVDEDDKHAFIQVLDGVKGEANYHEFEFSSFHADPSKFLIRIGRNLFSMEKIILQLGDVELDVQISDLTEFPSSFLRPGIMGWYSFVPMECNHALGSMHHKVNGSLALGNEKYELQGALGYIEKDWGSSFPKSWIWSQCNHFEKEKELSVFTSVAHIPWMGSYFIGFLAVLWWKGQHFVFATYNNAKRSTKLNGNKAALIFQRKDMRLEVNLEQKDAFKLKSPVLGSMENSVHESILSEMQIKVYRNNKLLIEDSGSYAGFEFNGEIKILEKDLL